MPDHISDDRFDAVTNVGAKATGLREFRRELKALEYPALTNDLKDINFRVAEVVRQTAVGIASGQGRAIEKAAETLKSARVASKAALILGNAKTPWAAAAEFGSRHNETRNLPNTGGTRLGWNQFKSWRGNKFDAGYFMYPAIRADKDRIVEMFGDEIMRLASRAFPDP